MDKPGLEPVLTAPLRAPAVSHSPHVCPYMVGPGGIEPPTPVLSGLCSTPELWAINNALQEFYANCPKGYEVDHLIPISKGGLHSLSNLQYLTKSENRRKSNKMAPGLGHDPRTSVLETEMLPITPP